MKTLVAATAAVASVFSMTGMAVAQSYPSQQVTMIIPWGPGGSSGVLGRFLAEALQERWGQTVVVEHHPGAGSMVGSAMVAQAEPNGHTIMFTTSSYVTAPAVYGDDLPFDPVADIAPVAMPGHSPFLIVGGANVQSDTLEEFLVEARERHMFLATAGLGSSTHFAGELFSVQADLPMTAVHYGGGGEAMTDLMGGHADIYVGSTAAVISNVRNGQLKAIGFLGAERAEELPDVQTTAEVGIDGLDTSLWFGVFTTGGTPTEIIEQLNADVNAILATEAFLDILATYDTIVQTTTAQEFTELVHREIALWKDLAEERGISGD